MKSPIHLGMYKKVMSVIQFWNLSEISTSFDFSNVAKHTWNKQIFPFYIFQDRNLFNIMSDEELGHFDAALTNEEEQQILEASGSLLLTAPVPSISFDLFDQNHIIPDREDRYSLDESAGNLEIIEVCRRAPRSPNLKTDTVTILWIWSMPVGFAIYFCNSLIRIESIKSNCL